MRATPPTANNAWYILVGSVAQGAGRLLTNLMVGHLAGPAILGVYASGVATGQVGALLWPTTLGSAATRFLSAESGTARGLFVRQTRKRLCQSAAIIAVLTCLIWAIFIGSFGGGLLVGLFAVAYSAYHVTRGILFGTFQFRRACLLDCWSTVAMLMVTAGTLLILHSGEYLLLGLVSSYVIYTTASKTLLIRDAGGSRQAAHLSEAQARQMDLFVLTGTVGTLASAGFMQTAVLAARGYGGSAGAGQFAAALALATPLALLSQALSQSLMPQLARAWSLGEVEAARDLTDRATRLLSIGGLLFFGPIAICSDAAVGALWGDDFDAARKTLPIMLAGVYISTLSVAGAVALSSHSQRGVSIGAGASVAGLSGGVLVWLTVGPALEETGVALGYLVGTAITTAIILLSVWRQHRLRWLRLFGTLVLGVAACGGLWWLAQGLAPPHQIFLAATFALSWALIHVRLMTRR